MNLKLFVFAAAAVTVLVAFAGAGSASASELTCGASMCPVETVIKAESEGKVVYDPPFGNVECNSTIEGHTKNTGSATETVEIPVTTLTFSSCNSGNTFNVLQKGTFQIHTQKAEVNSNGILTWTGLELEIVHLGVQCIFTTKDTELGTLTGSNETKGNATLDIHAILPRTGGSGGAFCGSSAPFTGSYKFTSPSTLNVD